MPTPWPNPIQGFTEGYLGGLQIARAKRQEEQQQRTQQLDDALKAMQITSSVIGNKTLPKQVRSRYMQDFSTNMNRVMSLIDPNFQPLQYDNNLEDTDVDYATRFGKIIDQWKKGDIDDKLFTESSRALVGEIHSGLDPKDAARIIESQVAPAIEQGIVSSNDTRVDTPLMQALRGTSPSKAKELEGTLTGKYSGELLSAYLDPANTQYKQDILKEIGRVDKKTALDIMQKESAAEGRMRSGEREKIRFKEVYRAAQQEQAIKDFRNIQTVPNRIERAKKIYDKTGEAGVLDDAILYALNKMNDPNSVVMIGEYMRTVGLQSWWDGVRGKLGKLTASNAGISPKFRNELYTAVTQAIGDKAKAYDERMMYFRDWGSDFEPNEKRLKNAFPLSSEIYGEKETPKANVAEEEQGQPGRKKMTFNPQTGVFE